MGSRATGDRSPIRKFEIASCTLQGLDRRHFVDGEKHGLLRGRHVEADDFGRFADEIGTGAPRFASRKVDFVGPQEPPDILPVHIAKSPDEQQRRCPVGQAQRRLSVKGRQNTAARRGSVLRLGATRASLTEAGDPILGVTDLTFAGRAGGAADIPPIARVAASNTIRAFKRVPCSVFVKRAKPASPARSSLVKIFGVVSETISLPMPGGQDWLDGSAGSRDWVHRVNGWAPDGHICNWTHGPTLRSFARLAG